MSSITEIDAAEGTEQDTVLPAKSTLSVIMPAYNEVATVAEILRRVLLQPVVSEIVLVDDGSTDGTWEAVLRFAESLPSADRNRLVLLQHDKNRGKGRAIRTALDQVSGTHVLIQDADLEYDPADIPKLWNIMQSGAADAVYGSRYLESPQLRPGRFLLQSGVRVLNLLARLLYGVRLTDQATCYKIFRTFDLHSMKLCCERFEFCSEVTAKAAACGLKIVEEAISYNPRGVAAGKKLRLSDGVTACVCLVRQRLINVTKETVLAGNFVRNTIVHVAPIAFVLVAVVFISWWQFGGISPAIAWVRGEIVYAMPHEEQPLQVGMPSTVSVSIRNLRNYPIKVIGAETDCGCVVTGGLPLEVAASSADQFTVKITPKATDAGRVLSREVALLLDVESKPIIVRVGGFVATAM